MHFGGGGEAHGDEFGGCRVGNRLVVWYTWEVEVGWTFC